MGLDASERIIDLILAAIIISGLPGTAAWALGLLVGINMVFGGTALIAMALQAREVVPARQRERLPRRWSLLPDGSRSMSAFSRGSC
jgi:hypothetical protein